MDFKNNIEFRKKTLIKLLHNIMLHEEDIVDALYKDFGKSRFETVLTETSYVIADLKYTLENIHRWSKPRWVMPSLLNFPSTDYIYSEPYGKVLIISPWNYPFLLALCPLIAAVAAGNSIVLKPSELTPATSGLISKIIRETFDVKHVVAVLGDATIAEDLLKKRWDYIFFTGSSRIGKIVARAAAENLTPITLELGGKNPCIIDETANLPLAARRIVWGKFLNAGQTCIAPDYILIHDRMKMRFLRLLEQEIIKAYGDNPLLSPDYPRIINGQQWKRLTHLIEPHKVVYGGESDQEERYLSPTIIDETDSNSPLMQDEIFGPILPVLSYYNPEEIKNTILKFEKPLSMYIFSENKEFTQRMIRSYSFGGGCINDTLIHFSNRKLPFGGVGQSGMGAYHGRYGFDGFTHKKVIVKKGNWLDIPLRYAPYLHKFRVMRKVMRWF